MSVEPVAAPPRAVLDTIRPPQKPATAQALPSDPAWQVAREFEGLMMGQLMKSMFSGVKTDGMFGGGQAEAIWRDFFLDHAGQAATAGGGVGLATAIYKDIKAMDEAIRLSTSRPAQSEE